jgi:hypothetical protein
MPETIDEMLVRAKPIVSDLLKKMNMIDEKIIDLIAARNKISNTGVTHPTVVSQIESLTNLIRGLDSLRDRIHKQLLELSKALKKHKIIGGGLDIDISNLMTSINEYLTELNKLDDQNMTERELDELNDILNALSFGVTDRAEDVAATVANMSGGKKRKTKKTKKTKKINKKSRKSRKH